MSEPLNQPVKGNAACPRCGQSGRAVSAVTVAAMLGAEASQRLTSQSGFRFCGTQDCEVAYFNPVSGESVLQGEVRVPIFQKGTDPQRLVCYCFGHTVGAIQNAVRSKRSSSILDDIKSKCAEGLDACERKNPQGSCCLGNVQRLIREAGTNLTSSTAGNCDCCGGD